MGDVGMEDELFEAVPGGEKRLQVKSGVVQPPYRWHGCAGSPLLLHY